MKENKKAEILIVDDEEEIRKNLSRHFRYIGYDVDTAGHGLDALRILEEKHMEVLITDIIMPEMNGIELMKAVREKYPTIQCIVMTGFVTVENFLAALKYGANTCIFKPIHDMQELEMAVKKAVENIRLWKRKLQELQGMKSAQEK